MTPLKFDARNSSGAAAYTNNLVLWTGQRDPSNKGRFELAEMTYAIPGLPYHTMDIRATLADETGEEWDTDPRTFAQQLPGYRASMATPWNFPSFPRRGHTLRFRIYAPKKGDELETLADFSFPNPLSGHYPVWKPSKLPSLQSDGPLEVALVKLVTGMETIPYNMGVRPFTRATFEVKENGQSTTGWVPDELTATDATGNEAHYFMTDSRVTNGLVCFEMEGTSLSCSEVWRVRARFPGPGTALWTSPEIPVRNWALVPMSLTTNVQSMSITVACKQRPFPDTIVLKVASLPDSTKLGSAIVDDQGRPAKYESGGFSDSGFDAQWGIPAGAKFLRVSVSLSQTRTFEFLAQPTVAEGRR